MQNVLKALELTELNSGAWSADGRHLAAGTADGGASLITFPAQMFK